MQVNKRLLGILLVLVYCFSNPIASSIVSHFEQHFPTIKLVFYNSLIVSMLFFSAYIFNKSTVKKIYRHFPLIGWINISNAVAWLGGYYCLTYLPPAIAIANIFCLQPCMTLLINTIIGSKVEVSKTELILIVFISLLVIMLNISYLNMANHQIVSSIFISIGIMLSLISALGTAATLIVVKKLSAVEFTTAEIMGLRFWLLTIIAFYFMNKYSVGFHLTSQQFLEVLGLAFIYIIIPIFSVQKAVTLIDPFSISLISPLQPVITYLFQVTALKQSLPFFILILIVLLCCLSTLSAMMKGKKLAVGNN